MDWLALAAGLVKALQVFFKWLGDRQLLNAGETRAILSSLDRTLEFVNDARKAAAHVRDDPDSDYSKRLHDKYRRPD